MVRDGDAVCIAAKVLEDVRNAAKGSLGVDDPGLPEKSVLERGEVFVVRESRRRASEDKLPAVASSDERLDEFRAEDPRERLDREDELAVALGVAPGLAVTRKPTVGDDAVYVRVELEITRPGVELPFRQP